MAPTLTGVFVKGRNLETPRQEECHTKTGVPLSQAEELPEARRDAEKRAALVLQTGRGPLTP